MPRPKVLVLASQKGGVGKTSLTAHIAVAAEMAGLGPVVLYDTDHPQGNLTAWYRDRAAETPKLALGGPEALSATLDRLGAAGVRLVVVDTPPSLSGPVRDVIASADFVLIPTQDGKADLVAIGRTVQMVREIGKPYAFALNFVKTGTKQATSAVIFLSKHGALAGIVAHRMIYKTAWNTGQTASELEGRKGRAAMEIDALWTYIGQEMGLLADSKKEKAYA